jgi:hypothetical protein
MSARAAGRPRPILRPPRAHLRHASSIRHWSSPCLGSRRPRRRLTVRAVSASNHAGAPPAPLDLRVQPRDALPGWIGATPAPGQDPPSFASARAYPGTIPMRVREEPVQAAIRGRGLGRVFGHPRERAHQRVRHQRGDGYPNPLHRDRRRPRVLSTGAPLVKTGRPAGVSRLTSKSKKRSADADRPSSCGYAISHQPPPPAPGPGPRPRHPAPGTRDVGRSPVGGPDVDRHSTHSTPCGNPAQAAAARCQGHPIHHGPSAPT